MKRCGGVRVSLRCVVEFDLQKAARMTADVAEFDIVNFRSDTAGRVIAPVGHQGNCRAVPGNDDIFKERIMNFSAADANPDCIGVMALQNAVGHDDFAAVAFLFQTAVVAAKRQGIVAGGDDAVRDPSRGRYEVRSR